jgi:hypothetical protein
LKRQRKQSIDKVCLWRFSQGYKLVSCFFNVCFSCFSAVKTALRISSGPNCAPLENISGPGNDGCIGSLPKLYSATELANAKEFVHKFIPLNVGGLLGQVNLRVNVVVPSGSTPPDGMYEYALRMVPAVQLAL